MSGERRVVDGRRVEPGDERRKPPRKRFVGFGQLVLDRLRGLDQRRGVGEPRLRLRERRPFVHGESERGELAAAQVEGLALGGGGLARRSRRVATIDGCTPVAPRGGRLAGERGEPAESVDQRSAGHRRSRATDARAGRADRPASRRQRRAARASPGGRRSMPGSALCVHRAPDEERRAVGGRVPARPATWRGRGDLRRRTRRRARHARRPAATGAARSGRPGAMPAHRAGSTCRRRFRRSAPRSRGRARGRASSTTTKFRIDSNRNIVPGVYGRTLSGVSLQCSFSRSIAKWSWPSGWRSRTRCAERRISTLSPSESWKCA